MSAEIHDLADHRAPVFYTIRIKHYWDGSLSCTVEDVSEDKQARKSVADAMRCAADQIEFWDVELLPE